jgi:hypothetical protein
MHSEPGGICVPELWQWSKTASGCHPQLVGSDTVLSEGNILKHKQRPEATGLSCDAGTPGMHTTSEGENVAGPKSMQSKKDIAVAPSAGIWGQGWAGHKGQTPVESNTQCGVAAAPLWQKNMRPESKLSGAA